MDRIAISYVLPLRRRRLARDHDLERYLHRLAEHAEVIVVDGSPPEIFAAHHRWFGPSVRHLAVDRRLNARCGKVNGVLTGVRAATHDRVVVADDDVRYGEAQLARVADLLGSADVVRPQNYFDPAPWHARWDTARSLLNRAIGADYPGTLAVRRGLLLDAGGYDGDCLFENLELIRTMEAAGGRVVSPLDLYVRRLPPDARHFWSQRVRQAYDDFALPARMAAELALLPAVVTLVRRRRVVLLGAGAAIAVATAEAGRRRAGGAAVFDPWSPAFAPLWLAERAVCAWLAVASRAVLGGVPYGGVVVSRSATSPRELRRRLSTVQAEPGGARHDSSASSSAWVSPSGA